MDEKNGIVVYCASSQHVDPRYHQVAREMGALIARNGYTLVNGGGALGLMASTIDGAADAGGRTVGVLPHFMIEKGWANSRLSECIDTPSMHVRKQTMASMSCAAVALAGGIGTLDELCEMMTWHQLGLFTGPVIIVNTDGFYDPLIEMFGKMQALSFMRGGDIPAVVVATPAEAMAVINASKTID
ncbi:MAG: TIGR00730 family Rossman fold protein [Duncaniella sp.]|nr:TIGR00730 family Rossman fold protein [Bacteroides sp.]MDE6038120.1 TIGR00730 family Rossman fold protein [Duncaniella sp.]MDE6066623.1 TIGR00730 family Rossman fold protein [Duncaniella sp.]